MQDCLGWFFELVLNICMKIATTNMQTAKSCRKRKLTWLRVRVANVVADHDDLLTQ